MRSSRSVALVGSLVTAIALVIAPAARADSGPQDVAYDTVAPQVSELTTALLRATKASGSPMQLTVATRAWAPDNATPKPTTFTRLRAYFDPSGSAMWWKIYPTGKVRQVGACDPQLGWADGFRYDCTFLYATSDGTKERQISSRNHYAGRFAWINVHAYELATSRGNLAGELVPPTDPDSSQTITKTVVGRTTTFAIVRDDRPYARRQTLTYTFTPTSVTRTITSTNYTLAAGLPDPNTGETTTIIGAEHVASRTVSTLAVTQPRPMTYPRHTKRAALSQRVLPVPTTLAGW
jgi:hypothetical protein